MRAIVATMLDTPLSETLEMLYRNRVSGLALLDPDGGRVACNFRFTNRRSRACVCVVNLCVRSRRITAHQICARSRRTRFATSASPYSCTLHVSASLSHGSPLRILTLSLFLAGSGQGVNPVVSVHENTTLGECMQTMAKERLHRVYITSGEQDAVRGLVSNSDVIKLVHKHQRHHHHHHHHRHHNDNAKRAK